MPCVCAPGYQGRKRGEVVRTRTVILQAHTQQLLGTFGGPGNGDYRGELRRAIGAITSYATPLRLSPACILVRLDGLYGDAAPLLDVLSTGLGVITRSRAYHLLDLEMIKQTLARPPDHVSTHPESGTTRALYDCTSVPLTPAGPEVRLVVATHAGTSSSPAVGIERDGMVYELFVSTLPSLAFTTSDVLDLYLHRGSFEATLADEDVEQNADRWYSHTRLSPGVRPDPRSMDREYPAGVGPTTLGSTAAHHRICPRALRRNSHDQRASTRGRTNASGRLRPTAMGPPILYSWLSRLRVYFAARWHTALPCQPPLVPARTTSRARWVPADLVCCTHRSLPFLPPACAMSRKQHDDQTAAGERGGVAALLFALRFLASS